MTRKIVQIIKIGSRNTTIFFYINNKITLDKNPIKVKAIASQKSKDINKKNPVFECLKIFYF